MTLEAGLLFSSGSVLGLSRAGEEQESRSILTCVNIYRCLQKYLL